MRTRALRTIRLDASVTFVFETAASPGEWAISGAFVFAHADPAALAGKPRAAFRAGFLGIESLGWSTLVQVVDVTEAQHANAVDLLARRFVERFGAPDLQAARAAAEEEIGFAASLAQHPCGRLVAVSRTFGESGIEEAFRSLRAAEHKLPSAYGFLQASDEEEPSEEVTLTELAKRAQQ
jgi:hypothetical protein